MDTLVCDPTISDRLIAERQTKSLNHLDEVWEGVYVMAPAPNNEHQEVVLNLGHVLFEVLKRIKVGKVLPGVNVSDQEINWEQNYRCPDVAVFLHNTKAVDRNTHWFGPPDFVVEILSPNDKSREKLSFYGELGTPEVLLVDRNPWQLELYRYDGQGLKLAEKILPGAKSSILSRVLPLSFELHVGDERPFIEIAEQGTDRRWTI